MQQKVSNTHFQSITRSTVIYAVKIQQYFILTSIGGAIRVLVGRKGRNEESFQGNFDEERATVC